LGGIRAIPVIQEANKQVITQPDFFSMNPPVELAPAFQAAIFRISTADFFKSIAVDALNIR
jgi:hypothetical protein